MFTSINLTYFMTLPFVVLMLLSCGRTTSSLVHTEMPSESHSSRVRLGTGYNSLTHTFTKKPCVGNDEDSPGGSFRVLHASDATMTSGYSEERRHRSHGFRNSSSVSSVTNGLNASGHAQTEFAFASTSLKTSVFTTYRFQAGNIGLINPAPTRYGEQILNDPSANRRFISCGDEFVYQQQLGGRLHIGLEFAFASQELKTIFDIEVKGSIEVGDYEEAVTFFDPPKFNEQVERIQGTVNLILEQEGGDREALNRYKESFPKDCVVLGRVKDVGSGVKKSYLEGFEQCIQAYNRIVSDYAAQQYPRQFQPLEKAIVDGIAEAGYVPLRTFTLPYDRAGYPEFSSQGWELPQELTHFLDTTWNTYGRQLSYFLAQLRALRQLITNQNGSESYRSILSQTLETTGIDDLPSLEEIINRGEVVGTESRGRVQRCYLSLMTAVERDTLTSPSGEKLLPDQIEDCRQFLNDQTTKINRILSTLNLNPNH